jgi:hypothetical protein
MDPLHVEVFTAEMDFLSSNVKNFDGLCNKLVGMGIITIPEHDSFVRRWFATYHCLILA